MRPVGVSRFSKIGGEMVPHGLIEESLQQASGADLDQRLAGRTAQAVGGAHVHAEQLARMLEPRAQGGDARSRLAQGFLEQWD